MKQLISLTALGLALTLGAGAHAAEDAKAPTKQQSKMATCNADEKAKTLKGDERKAFMKECLSANKQEKQQTKMKTCNADEKAKTLKGDERKAFMKECLKG
ncbi:MAG: phosphate starvation-inducible protein PsiF [Acidovorax sp.]|nr:MAG: phosphate starvation-inducible protein PsiF [Acidovorax sp.]